MLRLLYKVFGFPFTKW